MVSSGVQLTLTVAMTKPGRCTPGTYHRASVHEFNCNWIEGLKEAPLARHWENYGGNLAIVLHEFFGDETTDAVIGK